MQRLTVYSHPLRIIWQEGVDRSLATGRNAGIRRRYFTFTYVVRSGHTGAAAALLLFPEEKPDMQAAQQELARETPVAR